MLNLVGKRVYLACGHTDMRKGTNGLTAIVEHSFQLNLFDGALFVFCNRQRDLLKIIEWDSDGFWLHSKRLEKGHFIWPTADSEETMQLSGAELAYLLGGTQVELKIRRREVTEKHIAY